jgi:integrase
MKGEPEGVRDIQDHETLMDYYLDHRSVEPSTQRDYQKSWRRLQGALNELDYNIDDIQRSHVREILELWEDDDSLSNGRIDVHLNNMSRMADWCVTQASVADYNPFKPYKSEYKTDRRNKTEKIEIPLEQLRKLVWAFEKHRIEVFVFIVIILKTGLRHAEALNLDLRDINLDHPISEKMPQPRQEVYNNSDSLYVDSNISELQVHNGEKRAHGNKKNSHRIIPIDDELKSLIVWWMKMLPPTVSDAKPLLRQLNDPEHRRPTRGFTKPHITEVARDFGVNGPDMKHFGFDAHWCRHWFSTQLRSNINQNEIPIGTVKEYVQGLRGDTDDDVIDTYTHDWSVSEGKRSYREVYEDNIPQLLVKPDDQE